MCTHVQCSGGGVGVVQGGWGGVGAGRMGWGWGGGGVEVRWGWGGGWGWGGVCSTLTGTEHMHVHVFSVAVCRVCEFPHLSHGMLCDDISQYYFHWEVFRSVARVTKGCGMLLNMNDAVACLECNS